MSLQPNIDNMLGISQPPRAQRNINTLTLNKVKRAFHPLKITHQLQTTRRYCTWTPLYHRWLKCFYPQ